VYIIPHYLNVFLILLFVLSRKKRVTSGAFGTYVTFYLAVSPISFVRSALFYCS